MGFLPRVLVATAAPGHALLEPLLKDEMQAVFAFDLAQVARRLEEYQDVGLVLCTIHFDDSRMFDAVRYVRSRFPEMPCVCTRLLDSRLSESALESIGVAAQGLGATFIDRYAMAQRLGADEANAEFKKLLRAQIRASSP